MAQSIALPRNEDFAPNQHAKKYGICWQKPKGGEIDEKFEIDEEKKSLVSRKYLQDEEFFQIEIISL